MISSPVLAFRQVRIASFDCVKYSSPSYSSGEGTYGVPRFFDHAILSAPLMSPRAFSGNANKALPR